MVEAMVEAVLGFPRVVDDRRRLPLLASFQVNARLRSVPVTPRGLNKHVSTVTVARLRDRAEPAPIATRVFTRDQAEVAGELRWSFEAAPIDDLGRQHHRRVQ